jgi:hypothetical protein
MQKRDYFIAALQAGLDKKKQWVLSAFALVQEGPDAYKTDPYHLRLVSQLTGYSYYDQATDQLVPIKDSVVGQPLFNIAELMMLPKDTFPGVSADLNTNYGLVLLNKITVINSFNGKVPFYNKRFMPGDVEKFINPLLVDEPPVGTAPDPKAVYPSEYRYFAKACAYIEQFNLLFVPTATRKTMTSPDGRDAKMAELKERFGDTIHESTNSAQVLKELQALDDEYLKGDDGEGFLMAPKTRKINRTKLHLALGPEKGLSENAADSVFIDQPLNQGLDLTKMPLLVNACRATSFDRGSQTVMGGVSVKLITRAAANVTITTEDCGTKVGLPILLEGDAIKRSIGFHAFIDNQEVLLTAENIEQYKGKLVYRRSSQFCQNGFTDYCQKCTGPRIKLHPKSPGVVLSGMGDSFLLMFMKSMHGKVVETAHVNYKTHIV